MVRPVSLFFKLNHYQANYSVTEKEALALIWALQHFEVYVKGSSILVYTDHDPQVFLQSLRCPNQRFIRWSLFLQGYDLDFRRSKRTANVTADALLIGCRSPLP